MTQETVDAVVIGGGFYGCCLALFLHSQNKQVLIVERDTDILLRASYANQARIHNGYHYPRSFITAWRSLVNFPRFVQDFRECIDDSFQKIYAIARQHSKVNAFQFKRFCDTIGAPIQDAPANVQKLFNHRMIEQVFLVKEFAFDAVKLRALMWHRLQKAAVPILLETSVAHVSQSSDKCLVVHLENGEQLKAGMVFNCTYGQLNTLLKRSGVSLLPLKNEITEIALVKVPPPLKDLGITVMDGPFFSTMPFPAQNVHSLTHVRYTPHESWIDVTEGFRDAYTYLQTRKINSAYIYMLRDAARYLPVIAQAEYVKSLYEIKTVRIANEYDDGRPILVAESPELANFYSLLGSKIDNIYDMLAYLSSPAFQYPSYSHD